LEDTNMAGHKDFLSSRVKITQAFNVTAGAAAATAITGATLDMQGWEGVLVVLPVGAIVSGAVTSVKIQHGDASNLSDAADVVGTGQTVADTDDDKCFYIDFKRPTKRYCRVVVSRATQNSTWAGVYIQYGGRFAPSTQPTGIVGEQHVNAISGTA
jgi:hypothetical protein